MNYIQNYFKIISLKNSSAIYIKATLTIVIFLWFMVSETCL